MNAVDAKTGKLIWQTGSLGTGVSGGQFYSTPAVAFGRVYAGNNDDRVYSFDLSDGELAWTYSTGGYAYSAPTVASTKHSPPTVYIGSFDGNIYALNAKDGTRPLEPLDRRPGGRLALGDRRNRLRRRVHQPAHDRLHDAQRPQGLHLPEGHLHADHLRRPRPLPDRLLEHHRARTDPPGAAKIAEAVVAPAVRYPQRANGQAIGNAFVAPSPLRRRPGAAAAGAARRAHRRGTARRGAGR